MAIAILSFYGGFVFLYQIKGAFSKKPVVEKAAPAPVAAAVPASGVPSIESAAFEKFIETSAFEKLLENEEQLIKLAESA